MPSSLSHPTPTHHSPLTTHRFSILDGTRADAPEAGHWDRLCRQLPLHASVIPPRDAARAIGELAEEVNRRLAAGDDSAEPLFLVIHNLGRFRDLKKGDDFSFDDSAESGAAKNLATILREGPAVGVHALVWCDSLSNVNRWLDRQGVVHGYSSPEPGERGPFVQRDGLEWVLTAATPHLVAAHVGLIVWESELAFQFNEQHRLTSVRVRRRGISF